MQRQAGGRPWPRPPAPWVMAQSWHDLLFAHWPVETQDLRRLIPDQLPIDTFEGQSWIGVVPFRMSRVRMRPAPALPYLSAFPEINVRTYVTLDGRPGVFFFSLDAANRLAVAIARRWFHLPYFHARMSLDRDGDAVRYASRRIHAGAPPAEFRGRYRPVGDLVSPAADTLAGWLTARYCLYTTDRDGRLLRVEIDHRPWPLRAAETEIAVNTMTAPLGIALTGAPLLHFSRRLDIVAWPPRRIEG